MAQTKLPILLKLLNFIFLYLHFPSLGHIRFLLQEHGQVFTWPLEHSKAYIMGCADFTYRAHIADCSNLNRGMQLGFEVKNVIKWGKKFVGFKLPSMLFYMACLWGLLIFAEGVWDVSHHSILQLDLVGILKLRCATSLHSTTINGGQRDKFKSTSTVMSAASPNNVEIVIGDSNAKVGEMVWSILMW